MKRILFGTIALLSSTTTALAVDISVIDYMKVLPKKGGIMCPPAKLVVIYGSDDLKFCIEPASFIKTAYGGRARLIMALSSNGKNLYTATFQETNCLAMEERESMLWSISNYRGKNSKATLAASGWWFQGYDHKEGWTKWKPITGQTEWNEWICKRFKEA